MIAGQGGNQLDTIQMDFTARRFDTFNEVFTIEYYDDDQNLQELDLTGARAQMQLKKRKSDASPFFSMDAAISGNEITISKNHTMMDMPKGKYWFDIEIKDADGDHITWVQGRFVVVEHITHYVDTYLTDLWYTLKSTLSIVDVPKISYYTKWISTLLFQNSTVYWLKSIFKSTLKFESINFIVSKVVVGFAAVLAIATVPKTIFVTAFRLTVDMSDQVYYYSTGIFQVRVIFYEIQ